MASERREVDRGYKKRAHHRNAKGRVALSLPLGPEPAAPGGTSPGALFEKIASRLCDERRVACACAAGGDWRARLSGGADRGDVEILVECRACGRSDQLRVARHEFERVAREVKDS
jgi:hypothetical protein